MKMIFKMRILISRCVAAVALWLFCSMALWLFGSVALWLCGSSPSMTIFFSETRVSEAHFCICLPWEFQYRNMEGKTWSWIAVCWDLFWNTWLSLCLDKGWEEEACQPYPENDWSVWQRCNSRDEDQTYETTRWQPNSRFWAWPWVYESHNLQGDRKIIPRTMSQLCCMERF